MIMEIWIHNHGTVLKNNCIVYFKIYQRQHALSVFAIFTALTIYPDAITCTRNVPNIQKNAIGVNIPHKPCPVIVAVIVAEMIACGATNWNSGLNMHAKEDTSIS